MSNGVLAVQWVSIDPANQNEIPYSAENNGALEQAYQTNKKLVELWIDGVSGRYKVDIGRMEQINNRGGARKVKRKEITRSGAAAPQQRQHAAQMQSSFPQQQQQQPTPQQLQQLQMLRQGSGLQQVQAQQQQQLQVPPQQSPTLWSPQPPTASTSSVPWENAYHSTAAAPQLATAPVSLLPALTQPQQYQQPAAVTYAPQQAPQSLAPQPQQQGAYPSSYPTQVLGSQQQGAAPVAYAPHQQQVPPQQLYQAAAAPLQQFQPAYAAPSPPPPQYTPPSQPPAFQQSAYAAPPIGVPPPPPPQQLAQPAYAAPPPQQLAQPAYAAPLPQQQQQQQQQPAYAAPQQQQQQLPPPPQYSPPSQQQYAPPRKRFSPYNILNVDVGAVAMSYGRNLYVMKADLTQLDVDAIVNAANNILSHGAGLAEAIVRKGGDSIQQHSNEIMQRRNNAPLNVGDAVLTTAGALPSRAVVHVVGPNWSGGHAGERDAIQAGVAYALRLASDNCFVSIAIPAISSGIFGVPVDMSTAAVIEATENYFASNPTSSVLDVCFVAFLPDTVTSFVLSLGNARTVGSSYRKLGNYVNCVPTTTTTTAAGAPSWSPAPVSNSSVTKMSVTLTNNNSSATSAALAGSPAAFTLKIVAVNLLYEPYYQKHSTYSGKRLSVSDRAALFKTWRKTKNIDDADVFCLQEWDISGADTNNFTPSKKNFTGIWSNRSRTETAAIFYRHSVLKPTANPRFLVYPNSTKVVVSQMFEILNSGGKQIAIVSGHVPFSNDHTERVALVENLEHVLVKRFPCFVECDFNIEGDLSPIQTIFNPTNGWVSLTSGLSFTNLTARGPSAVDHAFFRNPAQPAPPPPHFSLFHAESVPTTPASLIPHADDTPKHNPSLPPHFSDHAALVFTVAV